jgi:hypothetical protein
MKTLPSLAVLALTVLPVVAQDAPPTWKVVKSSGEGNCQMLVPPDWPLGRVKGSAYQTESRAAAIVRKTRENTWPEVVASARQTYKPLRVIEETEARFWFEYAGSVKAPGASWYVAARAGDAICFAQISFKESRYQAEATRIAKSVAPAAR